MYIYSPTSASLSISAKTESGSLPPAPHTLCCRNRSTVEEDAQGLLSRACSLAPMASSSVAISPPSQPDFRKMNKQALRDALASRGLDTNGLRPSLIQRLESSVKALAAAEALSTSVSNETLTSNTETTEPLVNAPQIGTQTDLDTSAEGQTQTLAIHSETLTGDAQEDTLKLQDNTKMQEPATASGVTTTLDANMKASASKSNVGRARVTPCSTVENGKSDSKSSNTMHLSDLDRKRMRAERFGVGLQVSEKEKLALRAERYFCTS